MIIDPPYNTGSDFVYKDDFRDNVENYKRITGQVDGEGHWISANKENRESSGRFHTDCLNMMYPRLRLARNLLADDGVIIIHMTNLPLPCRTSTRRPGFASVSWRLPILQHLLCRMNRERESL